MITCNSSFRTLDKASEAEVWVLHDREWVCFKGQHFDIPLTICDGKPEELFKELQSLRDSCPKVAHTSGFAVVLEGRRLIDQEPLIQTRSDGTIRFALIWYITNYVEGRWPAVDPTMTLRSISDVVAEAVADAMLRDAAIEHQVLESARAAIAQDIDTEVLDETHSSK